MNISNNLKMMLLFAVVVTLNSYEVRASGITQDAIVSAQCVAIPTSKTYIDYKETASSTKYHCDYLCRDNSGKESKIRAYHELPRRDHRFEMFNLVCHNVKITEVLTEGTWLGEVDVHAKRFWATVTELPEIQKWAVENRVLLPESEMKPMLETMKANLSQVAASFQVGNLGVSFKDAGKDLAIIASGSAEGKKLLEATIEKLKKGTKPVDYKEQLVMQFVSAHGSFILKNEKAKAGSIK